MARKTKTMPPIHPGEMLREDFLKCDLNHNFAVWQG